MQQTILIIDDDVATIRLLMRCLRTHGFDIVAAAGGREGLRLAYTSHPDLVLLDLVMPDLGGLQVCQSLRDMSDVPIVVLSALSEADSILGAFRAGVDDYVIKPFVPAELVERLRAVLRGERRRHPRTSGPGTSRLPVRRSEPGAGAGDGART